MSSVLNYADIYIYSYVHNEMFIILCYVLCRIYVLCVLYSFWIKTFCICRQLLLCRVALGKSFLQFSAMKMAHAPPGHHSVVGRPSVGGLSFPEYVIYRGEQVTHREVTWATLTSQ